MPDLPSRADAACLALYRDGDSAKRSCTAIANGCSASIPPSSPWLCNWAAPIRPNWPRPRASAPNVGYREINLNVGCPSDRVQEGRFGACLMAEPDLVAAVLRSDGERRVHSGHREVPHRHRRPGRGGRFPALHRSRGGRGLPHVHRACPQGLAAGPVAEGEPRDSAARLRARLSPEGRAPGSHHRHQRRHRRASMRATSTCAMSMA